MKEHVKKFEEFLNESFQDYDINDNFNYLKKNHPRSKETDFFIEKVSDLLSGKVKTINRNEFKLKTGSQWGLEFIDDIVKSGFLSAVKKGNLIIITSNEDPTAKRKREDEVIKEINRALANRYPAVHYDKINRKFIVDVSDLVVTWQHFEKGHGRQISPEEIEEAKKNIENYLTESYVVQYVLSELDKQLDGGIFNIIKREEGEIERRTGGQMGFNYKITAEIIIK